MLLLFIVTTEVSAQGNNDFVESALNNPTFNWSSSESKGIKIYFQKGSFAERHRMMLLRSVATAKNEVLEFLGESVYDKIINVFYLESREEMERIVGRSYSGFTNWTASGIFVVFNPEWRSFDKHELTHLFTLGMWGNPDATSRWMIEGIAVYCDGLCREYAVDDIAFHFLSHNQLPPLKDFFNNYATLGEIRGGFYAASVIGFIRRTYGPEAIRNLWINGSGNVMEFLGDDLHAVESAWKNYLKLKVGKEVQIDLEAIEDFGCG